MKGKKLRDTSGESAIRKSKRAKRSTADLGERPEGGARKNARKTPQEIPEGSKPQSAIRPARRASDTAVLGKQIRPSSARERNPKSAILLGAHMSISGGPHMAIERGCSIQCTAMQIFVKNNMQWFARPLTNDEIRAFLDHAQREQLSSVFAHSSYLINLAATNPAFRANSLRALAEELLRAEQLELPFLVLHPGAHMAAGEEAGLTAVIESIDAVYAAIPHVKTRIALETTAGQGSCLGHRFEHLAHIISNVREPERLCVCLDTAHIFAAGYDISSRAGTAAAFREFDKIIGPEKLVALHLNDSKTEHGSRVDRHAHIGQGRIGLEAFRFIMRDRRLRKLPKVLETPKDNKTMREDIANMKTLISLLDD